MLFSLPFFSKFPHILLFYQPKIVQLCFFFSKNSVFESLRRVFGIFFSVVLTLKICKKTSTATNEYLITLFWLASLSTKAKSTHQISLIYFDKACWVKLNAFLLAIFFKIPPNFVLLSTQNRSGVFFFLEKFCFWKLAKSLLHNFFCCFNSENLQKKHQQQPINIWLPCFGLLVYLQKPSPHTKYHWYILIKLEVFRNVWLVDQI